MSGPTFTHFKEFNVGTGSQPSWLWSSSMETWLGYAGVSKETYLTLFSDTKRPSEPVKETY